MNLQEKDGVTEATPSKIGNSLFTAPTFGATSLWELPRKDRPSFALVACLGERGNNCVGQFAHNSDPAGLAGLPGPLVLAAHIGPIDDFLFYTENTGI